MKLSEFYENDNLYDNGFYLLLDKAYNLNENTKFSLLFFDNIISLFEKDSTLIKDIIDYNVEVLYNADNFKVENYFNKEENVENQNTEEKIIESIENKHPFEVFLEYLKETSGCESKMTKEDYLKAFYDTAKNQNITQIYTFILNKSKDKQFEGIEEIFDKFDENINVFKEAINQFLKDSKSDYEKNNEIIHVDLDEYLNDVDSFTNKTTVETLRNYLMDVIPHIVFSDKETKGYTISMVSDRFKSIATFKHFYQSIDLLETQKIDCSKTCKYVALFNFVKNNEKLSVCYDAINKDETCYMEVKLAVLFKEVFDKETV